MKKIENELIIEKWIEENRIRENFDTKDLAFEAYTYEKGELIISPLKKQDQLLFLVEGIVQIYGILENGRMIPVNQSEKPALLGDLEFINKTSELYCESFTDTRFVALPIEKNRQQLDTDLRFLHLLLHSYAGKLKLFTNMEIGAPRLDERVLFYMKELSPKGELQGMDTSALKLRCSRRQLQRVLKQLCEEGKICKTGKGHYRINENDPS